MFHPGIVAMVLFARRIPHLTSVETTYEEASYHDGSIDTHVDKVHGELFFASSNDLVYHFDYIDDPANVIINLTGADIWDASTVATLDAIRQKYEAKDKNVEIIGLDSASMERHDHLNRHLAGAH